VIKIIAQGIVLQDDKILMVRQYVKRGDVVWNFPGGFIEYSETPEQACIREIREETGYDVSIKQLVLQDKGKYTYEVDIVGGSLHVDMSNPDNADILEACWVSVNNAEKFDSVTRPIIDFFLLKPSR